MGALFFLLLAVLGVLLFRSRTLRRAPLHEAVYEEIEYKLARGGTYSAPRWGDLVMEDIPENYDDVITADKHPDSVPGELVEGDATEHYDDVITMHPRHFSRRSCEDQQVFGENEPFPDLCLSVS
ncbi:uncharacterized protein LOC135249377 isoform X4 [Anguilla rostrata]|uniref:uncharacterized protein LOC135249377 isoform X4 n=1 Tax=Anguilla rostrata TaxID=7938 RepID=UPI0030D4A312